MSKNNKISYYSMEDIDKIGIVDNINCSEKSLLGIIVQSIPYLLILGITNIIPMSEGISIIVFISIKYDNFYFFFFLYIYMIDL